MISDFDNPLATDLGNVLSWLYWLAISTTSLTAVRLQWALFTRLSPPPPPYPDPRGGGEETGRYGTEPEQEEEEGGGVMITAELAEGQFMK